MSRRSALGRGARALGALLALSALPAAAQDFAFTPKIQPEVRIDGAFDHYAAGVLMVGANVPLGYYVRAGASVGAGVASVDAGAFAVRADATTRFLLDPFGQTAWGPYAGGGLTVRRDGTQRARLGLLMVLGVEARRGRRWVPSIEAALGEGARVAVVLRKARVNGR